MPATQMKTVVGHLRRMILHPRGDDLTDGQLLEDFYARHEEGAFQALVRRHGAMVLGVCRRILRNTHDAEDAFQAVFLVLARKGHGFLKRETIGNWLYGVAYHTALKARAETMKRRSKESQVKPRTETADDDKLRELQPLLDQELSRLADKYREPVVLCELQGMPRKDAARQLGISEGTLSSRLATARRMLAKRLGRHVPTLSVAALTTLLSEKAVSAAPPTALVVSTAHAAGIFTTGQATAGVISAHVVALTEGVLQTMFLTKLKLASAVVLLVVFLCIGLGTLAISAQSPAPTEANAAQDAKQPGKDDKKDEPKKVDPKEKQDPKAAEDKVIDSISGLEGVILEGKVRKLTIKSITTSGAVDCNNLEAEEIEIESMTGLGSVTLELARGKLKKLTIGNLSSSGMLDCSDLEVDVIEIGSMGGLSRAEFNAKGEVRIDKIDGSAQLRLKTDGKIAVGSVGGLARVDVAGCKDFNVAKNVDGSAHLNLKAKGNVAIDSVGGLARVKVSRCQDFSVAKEVQGSASVQARYHGTAKCEAGGMLTRVQLTKIESPK